MLYILRASCLTPFLNDEITEFPSPATIRGNRVIVKEPAFKDIPPNVLRRMGKAMRMGAGVSLPMLQEYAGEVAGMIIGTANGGTEDSFRFLREMTEYGEEALSPGGFVQSTANALAAQLSLMQGNKGYNVTHVHRGLAFERALEDAVLSSKEDWDAIFLLAGIDELSHSNFVLDILQGWYRPDVYSGEFYASTMPGTIAGEGAAAFLVSGKPQKAMAAVSALTAFDSEDETEVERRLAEFLGEAGEKTISLVLTGDNGDSRLQKYYTRCEALLPSSVPVARFKHGCGEYPTASGVALWIACLLLSGGMNPGPLLKRGATGRLENILIYNHYKGRQHSFILVSAVV